MGKHRMLSLDVVEAFEFMELPITAQYLYMHLALNTDDRGVVEAGNVLRLTMTNRGDLQVLIDHDKIIVLDDNSLVSFVTDHNNHNKLRSDRMTESLYIDLLRSKIPNLKLQEIKPRADRNNGNAKSKKQSKKNNDVPGTSQGRPADGVREGNQGNQYNQYNTHSATPWGGSLKTNYDYADIESQIIDNSSGAL